MLRICGPRDKSGPGTVVNTTSHDTGWGRGLSPFYLGPVGLYNGHRANVFENAWQYAKVYPQHVQSNGEPSEAYFRWAEAGWAKGRAVRYPMGRGKKPFYSYWDGEKLGYIEARKKIYIPLYSRLVADTGAFRKLKELYETEGTLWLWDFDGYDHVNLGMNLNDVVECKERKMGHAFVLAMLLEGFIEAGQRL